MSGQPADIISVINELADNNEPETWLNAVIIITSELPETCSEADRRQAAQQLAARFADDPNLLVSISAQQHKLRAKIQHPLDLDPASSAEQRQSAVRQAALDLGADCEYYWELVDNFGQLQQQGELANLEADKLLPSLEWRIG